MLRELMDDRLHRICAAVDQPHRLGAAAGGAFVDGARADDDRLLLDTTDLDGFGRHAAPLAAELGLRLHEVVPLDDDLESVFRYLVDR
ncbi:MAG: hypothetical protein R2695_08035 [Acidimicrobiales bacterium]